LPDILDDVPEATFREIRKGMAGLHPEQPEVSIVIIAYNEERNLLATLSSLSQTRSSLPTELLVVNNNSTDRTQEILDRCGVTSVFEARQGIGWARQAGLEAARGRFIINGDADSIYPPHWSEAMALPLREPEVTTVYSRYSFIPSRGWRWGRLPLAVHEAFASGLFRLRRRHADPVNVLGFSFAFRKADAEQVGGFQVHGRHRWEDGLMVLALSDLGRIQLVRSDEAWVWTSDRRLLMDGGYRKAFFQRTFKHLNYMPDYLNAKRGG
jgi:glycosyltransferase involved in cell wall biosynthesis